MRNQLLPSSPRDELVATLALLASRAVAAERLGALVDQIGSAVRLVQQSEADRLFAWREVAHDLVGRVTDELLTVAAAQAEQFRLAELIPRIVLDSGYPDQLHEIFNRPALLFVRGYLSPVPDVRAVAVVGARNADERALKTAREIVRDLVAHRFVIISGLARGIDSAAHEEALQRGGTTWAVLGSGLNRIYPSENAGLAERIVECGGAVVSQFLPDQGPARWTFPMRNVVMSGLSTATVVIEASHTSGARLQARVALQHGRTVFLHSRLVDRHEWAQKFVAEGAYGTRAIRFSSAADIIERIEQTHAPEISAST